MSCGARHNVRLGVRSRLQQCAYGAAGRACGALWSVWHKPQVGVQPPSIGNGGVVDGPWRVGHSKVCASKDGRERAGPWPFRCQSLSQSDVWRAFFCLGRQNSKDPQLPSLDSRFSTARQNNLNCFCRPLPVVQVVRQFLVGADDSARRLRENADWDWQVSSNIFRGKGANWQVHWRYLAATPSPTEVPAPTEALGAEILGPLTLVRYAKAQESLIGSQRARLEAHRSPTPHTAQNGTHGRVRPWQGGQGEGK